MSDIFSEEMKKEIIKLFDKRLIQLKINEAFDIQKDVLIGIEKNVKEINNRLVDVEDIANDFENSIESSIDEITFINRMNELEQQVESMNGEYVHNDELEQVVGKTMLKLIPNFNERIAKEIKKHLVSIAEFVIKNFKEKE